MTNKVDPQMIAWHDFAGAVADAMFEQELAAVRRGEVMTVELGTPTPEPVETREDAEPVDGKTASVFIDEMCEMGVLSKWWCPECRDYVVYRTIEMVESKSRRIHDRQRHTVVRSGRRRGLKSPGKDRGTSVVQQP